MKVEHQIYTDKVIEIALCSENTDSAKKSLFDLAIRYLEPQSFQNGEGKLIDATNKMGGETDWFILPYTFGVAIAKTLIEQKASGLAGFNEKGFGLMMNWLIEMEEVNNSLCY